MSISTELQEYFADLVKPLATNLDMIKMFEKFKGEIVEKFELKLEEEEEEEEEEINLFNQSCTVCEKKTQKKTTYITDIK